MAEQAQDRADRLRIGGLICAVAGFSVAANLLVLTGPLFMLQVYDRVLTSGSVETLTALTLLMVACFAAYGLLDHARGAVMVRIGAVLHEAAQPSVFHAALRQAASGHAEDRTRAASLLSALAELRAAFATPFPLAVLDVAWTPVFLGVLFLFHPALGWLAIAGGVVLALAAALAQYALRGPLAQAATLGMRTGQDEGALLAGAQAVAAHRTEDRATLLWMRGQNDLSDASLMLDDRARSFAAFTRAFRFMLQSLMVALGAWLVLRGMLGAGAMIAGSILMGRALAPIEQIVTFWPAAQRARQARQRLRRARCDLPRGRRATPGPDAGAAPRSGVEITRLGIAPRSGSAFGLHDLSCRIPPGGVLGVIGANGAGKSLFAQALAGLVPPSEGVVRIGGRVLDGPAPGTGYLPQFPVLLPGDIAANIARLAPDPDKAEVERAATLAGVHAAILALPRGYATCMEEARTRLSGGQIRQLALARALFGRPALLILDEPDAMLDAEGCAALGRAVSHVTGAGGCAVIVSHRPGALALCDTVLALDRGRCDRLGPTHEMTAAYLHPGAGAQVAAE